MKNILKRCVVCGTIVGLFVLAAFANQYLGLLGPKAAGIALVAGAFPPPGAGEVTWANGPFPAPDPVDIPVLRAKAANGPFPAPDPVDIPGKRQPVANGPFPAPDPVDIPGGGAGR